MLKSRIFLQKLVSRDQHWYSIRPPGTSAIKIIQFSMPNKTRLCQIPERKKQLLSSHPMLILASCSSIASAQISTALHPQPWFGGKINVISPSALHVQIHDVMIAMLEIYAPVKLLHDLWINTTLYKRFNSNQGKSFTAETFPVNSIKGQLAWQCWFWKLYMVLFTYQHMKLLLKIDFICK